MTSSTSPLNPRWLEPALRPIAPVICAAWEDGHLSPAELLAVRDALDQVGWLDAEAKELASRWLDPAHPPTPQELAALTREVEASLRGLSDGAPSLAEACAALVESQLGQDARSMLQSALVPLDATLSESRLGNVRRSRVATPGIESHAGESERLRLLLDGDYRRVRDDVRRLLADPRFRFVSTRDTSAYREQVLAWCKAVSDAGLSEKAQAFALEAMGEEQPDAGEFITAFETLSYFDLSMVVKVGVQFGLFGGAVAGLGTAKHHAILPAVTRCELLGCFAMTERAHGSNVRDLKTIARYEPATREFVIHTPNLAAGKEWIGNAALHARLAVVFAQLETQGENHGVHAFLVPIRDERGEILPGVKVEDCGEKMGLNGVDNGRLWFESVRVPREALLDRFGQVAEDGAYASSIPSPSRRFFTMLGTLVGGRISVAGGALSAAKSGLTIALRYAAHRTQFADGDGPEKSLIDYLSHQRRLIPRLAAAYAFSFAQNELVKRFAAIHHDEQRGRDVEKLAAGVKALGTWQAIETLQQCRESCGGQGYLTSNRIDALRTDTDVFTTFEGDNTVLLQLVAKNILSGYQRELAKRPIRTIASAIAENVRAAVVDKNPAAIRNVDSESLLSFEFQERALSFREKSLRESLSRRLKHRVDGGMSVQQAFDACQDHALSLAKAYIEHFVLGSFQAAARDDAMLARLCSLYGLWRIEADLAWFLENDYLAAPRSRAIRSQINELVAELRDHTGTLVDAFGIPETCLGPLADPAYLTRTGLAAEDGGAAPSA